MPPYRQNIANAVNGTITGRGGRTQQLGAAAQRRLGQQSAAQPAKPAWQQLRDAGQQGTGSAAGNRAAAANPPYAVSKPLQLEGPPMPPPGGGMGPDGRSGAKPMSPYGADGVMNELPALYPGGGGGMASYLRPGAIGQLVQGVQGAAGPMAGMQKPGVDSNPFAQAGGTPNGEPLQAAQGRAGQAGRIAQLIQRLRGGGAPGQQRMMYGNVPPEVSAAVGAMF